MKLISFPVGKKTSTRCLKDVLSTQARHFVKTPCRCTINALKANLKVTFVRHVEDTFARYIVDGLQNVDMLLIYLNATLNLSEDVS